MSGYYADAKDVDKNMYGSDASALSAPMATKEMKKDKNFRKFGCANPTLGMNITDAVTIFLKQVVMTESIPFIIKKPKFSDEMLEAIKEADDIAKNPDKYKSYNNLSEILEDINNDETIWNQTY